jgi:phage terminase large subunit-like protein
MSSIVPKQKTPRERILSLKDESAVEVALNIKAQGFWYPRGAQKPPLGDWRIWLLLAGRGFGKTRTGAEFVRGEIEAGRAHRVALVASTALDARNVMVEGESGILNIGPRSQRPIYEPSLHRLTWDNRAVATIFSADEPDRLRGPQHDLAWCDELAAWRYPAAWDMLKALPHGALLFPTFPL